MSLPRRALSQRGAPAISARRCATYNARTLSYIRERDSPPRLIDHTTRRRAPRIDARATPATDTRRAAALCGVRDCQRGNCCHHRYPAQLRRHVHPGSHGIGAAQTRTSPHALSVHFMCTLASMRRPMRRPSCPQALSPSTRAGCCVVGTLAGHYLNRLLQRCAPDVRADLTAWSRLALGVLASPSFPLDCQQVRPQEHAHVRWAQQDWDKTRRLGVRLRPCGLGPCCGNLLRHVFGAKATMYLHPTRTLASPAAHPTWHTHTHTPPSLDNAWSATTVNPAALVRRREASWPWRSQARSCATRVSRCD